jgi:glycosyltransferase involved in cell wall biosynthesis
VRILKVAQTYYPYVAEGGRPAKVRALARLLAQRGNNVTVLTAELKPGVDINKLTNAERQRWGWRAEDGGTETIYLLSRLHFRRVTLNPGVVSFCVRRLREFDIVHVYGLYDLLGPTVAYFCRRWAIPYVVEPMGMFRPIDRSFRLKHFWHMTLGGSYGRNASRIIATSELEQRDLLEEGFPPQKVLLRYNGIDLEDLAKLPGRGKFRVKWGIDSEEFLILFLGRLIPRKGADMLIESFREACPVSGILVIAGPEGEPGYLELLRNQVRQLALETRVLFTGPLYDEEKKAALADADLFVLPSRYENFANAAAEAIACQVPVIVTDSCGISSLVDQRAGIVVPVDREALTGALVELIGNTTLYGRLRSGCKDVARSISWSRLTELMEQYYADILTEKDGIIESSRAVG